MMRRSTKPLASRPRRGMVLVQLALALSLLMTVLAVGVDLGFLLVERRHAQATADAAALAAASDLYANEHQQGLDGGTAIASAMGVASANGYTNDGTTSKVMVNISAREDRQTYVGTAAGRLCRGDRDVVPETRFQRGPRHRDHPRQRPGRRARQVRDRGLGLAGHSSARLGE